MSLVMAVVYETVDGEGLRSYIAKLYRLPEEKPYSMLARGPRWTHKDIAVLVQRALHRGFHIIRIDKFKYFDSNYPGMVIKRSR